MPFDPAGLAPYLTAADALARLSARFGLTDAALMDGDLHVASDELDAMRPFVGWRRSYQQWRQFPRDIDPDGSIADPTVPEAILDAVALIAYSYATDDDPPVTAETGGGGAVTYFRPKPSVLQRRIQARVGPYLRKRGRFGPPGPYPGADPLNQRRQ